MPQSSMPQSYPRDLIGYGSRPPHANWPGGARVAVQFVINYEEGGRTASCTATPRRKPSCRRSSAPSPSPACGT